jgi:2-methylcitrate dehydratase PrpD
VTGPEPTTLEKLGIFVAQSPPPPEALRDMLALHVADIVGAWIAGLHTTEGAALVRWRSAMGEVADVALMHTLRLNVATHCALARLSEIDDIHLASMMTPGAIVVPAAVAIAAALEISDADALAAAVLAGYEVMIRLGRAMDEPAVLYRGIWPTYFATPAGVAVVAARLLALDAKETANALALALARSAPGVGHHNAVTTTRWLAIGQAAESGLVAALAARAGFTADLALLDGGFLPGIYDVKPDLAVLTAALGEKFALGETSFKPWCAARQTMAATQAMIEILGVGLLADAIVDVKAFVLPPHRRMIDHGVTIGDRASFLTSVPYHLAVAALSPQDAFHAGQSPLQVPDNVRALMGKVSVEPDDALMTNYPLEWPARVAVATSSGRHVRTVTRVPGDPSRRLDAAAVSTKFRRFVAPAIGADAATRMLECAFGLLEGRSTAAELFRDIESVGGAAAGEADN